MEALKNENMKNINVKSFFKEYQSLIYAYGGLFITILFFTIVPPFFDESIWTLTRMNNLVVDVIVLAIMSIGATFVYSLGEMDISIGKQLGLFATLLVFLGNQTGSIVTGLLLSIVISLLIAFINGATGEFLKIHPIISSVVIMMILSGISTIIYTTIGTRSISLRDVDVSIFRNPLIMISVLIFQVVIVSYLFNKTKLGKYTKSIGANKEVAKQAGINIIKYKVIAYIIMGLSVVVASLFQMGYTGSASESTGTGMEMNVLVAMVLGGMPLSGGMRSKVISGLVGSLTLSFLNIGLPLIGVAPNQVFVIRAVIVILVVLITARKKHGVLPR